MLDLLLLVQWHPPFMILAPSCNMHCMLCNPCGRAYLHRSHHPGHVSDNTLDYVPGLGALHVMACVSQTNHIYNAVVMCRLIHTLGQCCDQVMACQTALRDLNWHSYTIEYHTSVSLLCLKWLDQTEHRASFSGSFTSQHGYDFAWQWSEFQQIRKAC